MTLSYDDNAASVFGVTMLLFYLFPATWYIIKRIRTFNQKLKAAEGGEVLVEDDDMPLSTTGKGKAVEPRSRAEARKIQLLKATAKRDVLWTKGFKLFILGTVAVALLFLYLLFRSTGQAELAQYDPYAILGLSSDASETEINKAYRKLARQYHPDMPTGDVDMFQKVKKAHDALTDEVIKENYRLYGNPDGRQALEVSIGLPNFLKGGFSGWFLVLFYMALLVGFLPYLAFRFYRKNKDKNSTTGLHEGSHFWLSNRLATFPEGTTVRLMPEIIGGCIDFTMDHKVPADDGSNSLGNPFNHAGLKELLNQCRKEGLFTDVTPSDPQKNRNRWIVPKEYVARHALLLLAHCNKSKLAASQVLKGLTTDQLIVQLSMLKQMTKICDLMIQMCVELEATTERRAMMAAQRADIPSSQKPQPVRYFEAIRNIAVFQQLVTQGLWEGDKTLRVIFPEQALISLYSKDNKGHRPTSLGQYLAYPPSERPVPPALTDAEKTEVERIVGDYPLLDVAVKAEVEGCDEGDIREEDILTVTVTVTHKNLVNESLGGYGDGDADTPVPPVYAPVFPYPRKEEWWIFIVDEGKGAPTGTFRSAERGVKKLVLPAFQKFTPTKAVETVKMQFQAPPLAGSYGYSVHVLSTCYVDADKAKEFSFEVKEALGAVSEGKKKKKKAKKTLSAEEIEHGHSHGGHGHDDGDDDDEEEEEDNDADMALENLLSGGNRDVGDYDSDLDAEAEDGDEEESEHEEEKKKANKKGSSSAAANTPSSKAVSSSSAAATASASTPKASPSKPMSAEEAAAAAAAELLAEEDTGKAGSAKKGGKGASAKKSGKGSASASKCASSSSTGDNADEDNGEDDDDVNLGVIAGGARGLTGGALRNRKK